MRDAFLKVFAYVLVTALFGVFVLAPAFILWGWVIVKVWGWFAVPLFHLPQIAIAQAVGLKVLVSTLNRGGSSTREKKLSPPDMAKDTIRVFVFPLVLLGVAYVAHLYVPGAA